MRTPADAFPSWFCRLCELPRSDGEPGSVGGGDGGVLGGAGVSQANQVPCGLLDDVDGLWWGGREVVGGQRDGATGGWQTG